MPASVAAPEVMPMWTVCASGAVVGAPAVVALAAVGAAGTAVLAAGGAAGLAGAAGAGAQASTAPMSARPHHVEPMDSRTTFPPTRGHGDARSGIMVHRGDRLAATVVLATVPTG